jgi:D-alanyl-D-alanine carboxypeptidase
MQGQQGRPMTDEERRRLAAARARMNNGAAPRPAPNGGQVPQRPANGQRPVAPNGQPRPNPNNPNGRPQAPNRAGQPQSRPPESYAGRRRKRKVKINAGAVIFLLLIAGVVGVSAYQISHSPASAGADESQERLEQIIQSAKEEAILNDTYLEEEVPVTGSDTLTDSGKNPVAADGEFGTVTVQNSALDQGELVLVNFQHAYGPIDEVELMNAYTERTGKIKVSSTTLGMIPEAFHALEELVAGLVDDTGCDDLLLYSGHRSLAEQQRIWDSNMASYGEDYTKTYVAVPGHSEHHSGYACDLGFYTDDGLSIPLVDHEYGPWVWAHCTEYGYILRYPEDKADITGIGHEQWHFRYVGLPHAYAVDVTGFCFEEYLEHLKNYTADTKMLHISGDRRLTDVNPAEIASLSGGWLTYYVPAADGDTTGVKLPGGAKFGGYEISGNNVDGFIVTITLGE